MFQHSFLFWGVVHKHGHFSKNQSIPCLHLIYIFVFFITCFVLLLWWDIKWLVLTNIRSCWSCVWSPLASSEDVNNDEDIFIYISDIEGIEQVTWHHKDQAWRPCRLYINIHVIIDQLLSLCLVYVWLLGKLTMNTNVFLFKLHLWYLHTVEILYVYFMWLTNNSVLGYFEGLTHI